MDKLMNKLINNLIEEFNMCPIDINGCYCYGFAEDLSSLLYEEGFESEIVSNENFFIIDSNDNIVGWSEKEFIKYNLNVPKYNAKDSDFYHVFVYSNNLFYDAETSDGVAHWFDLPFYKRVVDGA